MGDAVAGIVTDDNATDWSLSSLRLRWFRSAMKFLVGITIWIALFPARFSNGN
jgi:hypothetical protein